MTEVLKHKSYGVSKSPKSTKTSVAENKRYCVFVIHHGIFDDAYLVALDQKSAVDKAHKLLNEYYRERVEGLANKQWREEEEESHQDRILRVNQLMGCCMGDDKDLIFVEVKEM